MIMRAVTSRVLASEKVTLAAPPKTPFCTFQGEAQQADPDKPLAAFPLDITSTIVPQDSPKGSARSRCARSNHDHRCRFFIEP